MILSIFLIPSILSCAPGLSFDLYDLLAEPFVEDLVDETALARSRHTRHAHEFTERYVCIYPLQIVLRSPFYHDLLSVAVPSDHRDLDGELARQVLPRQRLRAFLYIIYRALRHQLAAVDPRSGTYIYNMIRSVHGLFVMLHHQQSIAGICQFPQRSQQFGVVLLMRPMLGSSSIYSTPTSPDPICVASLILWDSPPERVPADRDIVR